MAGSDAITLLRVKSFEREGERWLEGIATNADVDRVGDSVNPEGAVYELPLVLLAYHDHSAPIGTVTEIRATKAGIRIRARISEGVAKADEIWTLIRDGVLNACSIGFRALKSSPMKNGGRRFDSYELLEISIVSVPAHPGARISIAKCMAMKASDLQPVYLPRTQPAQLGYAKATRATGASSIKVIVGPPCAGKTTYVLSQMKAGDVRVDYDEIAKAFGSNKAHDATGPVREVALAARQSAIYRVMRGVESDAWIIHTNPRADMIEEYKVREAEFVMVNPGKEECLARAENRPEGTTDAIEGWFASPPTLPKHETVKMMRMTSTKSTDYFERIAHAVKAFVTTSIQPLDEKVMALEEQITRIQSKGVSYRGIYNQSDVYVRGDLVTHGGSIFHAARNTAGISPAHGGDERKALDHPWQLAVRRGRDSK